MLGNVQYYCNLNKKNVRKREGAITRQKKNTQIQEFWGLYIEGLLTCLLLADSVQKGRACQKERVYTE